MNKLIPPVTIILAFAAVLYGASYQQFLHFDINDPRGANDSGNYIRMSHDDFSVKPIHRYRFVIPQLAKGVRFVVQRFSADVDQATVISFYVVNYLFTLITALIFLKILQCLGFDFLWSAIGVMLFMTSRITILITGTPLIDSFYFFAIVVILLLTLSERIHLLSLAVPLIALSKETILPLLLIPLFTRKGRSIEYGVSLIVSAVLVITIRHHIDGLSDGADISKNYLEFNRIVQIHGQQFFSNMSNLFTLRGLYIVQNGYSFFLAFAVLGLFLNDRERFIIMPAYFIFLMPLMLAYAFLSGNMGRMFFGSFPVIIPYALIFLKKVFDKFVQDRNRFSGPHEC